MLVKADDFIFITPASTKLKGGILVSRRPSVCPSVRLSICPSVCGQNGVRSVSSTILVGSISYLYILSSNSSKWIACMGYCIIPTFTFWHFLGICNFDFVFLCHGIWCESLVWVIMGRRGISKRRRYSCSSLLQICWYWYMLSFMRHYCWFACYIGDYW